MNIIVGTRLTCRFTLPTLEIFIMIKSCLIEFALSDRDNRIPIIKVVLLKTLGSNKGGNKQVPCSLFAVVKFNYNLVVNKRHSSV